MKAQKGAGGGMRAITIAAIAIAFVGVVYYWTCRSKVEEVLETAAATKSLSPSSSA